VLTDVLVPHNRWDLLADHPSPRPEVTVVVTHYEQPAQLARTLAALDRQTLAPVQVVVADDGSAVLPSAGAATVVTQPDLGFRAGAARNLGARHAVGEVLVFLDADTVPEPGFVEAITRHVALCPDVLAVGRRRHADLGELAPGGDPAAAPRLPEPAWLREAYAASRDLLDADGRSFRYVISAALACRRALFADLDGFDERFVGYGGEDWDLAYRAWNAGAVLVHERGAVAWHDGPDWAARRTDAAAAGALAVKDAEAVRLAALIPEPATRGVALPGAVPDVLVDVAAGPDAAETVRTVHALLAQDHRDLRIRLTGPVDPGIDRLYGGLLAPDPWTPDQLRRARVRADVAAPLPPDAIATAVRLLTDGDRGEVTLCRDGRPVATAVSTRAVRRANRWQDRDDVLDTAFGRSVVDVDAGPAASGGLEGFFARR
jgi:GT2 family glycosyltransferase